MKWEIILWTCITLCFLLCIGGILLSFISIRSIRKRKKELQHLHTNIKPGTKIILSSGIYGTIVQVYDDILDVEVSKDIIIKANRYSIQRIEK